MYIVVVDCILLIGIIGMFSIISMLVMLACMYLHVCGASRTSRTHDSGMGNQSGNKAQVCYPVLP
jgi:hypothetical protein